MHDHDVQFHQIIEKYNFLINKILDPFCITWLKYIQFDLNNEHIKFIK